MSLCPAELLDRVEAAGGDIRVLPDGSLDCVNIPVHLVSEVQRHAGNGVLQAVLTGECDHIPVTTITTVTAKEPKEPKKRRTCLICKVGTGCRKRGVFEWLPCPRCGHGCRAHYPAEHYAYAPATPAGCHSWQTGKLCDCPGWPETTKRRRKEKAVS